MVGIVEHLTNLSPREVGNAPRPNSEGNDFSPDRERWRRGQQVAPPNTGHQSKGGLYIMFEWIDEHFVLFIILMLVILGGLVGALLYLRNKRSED